MSIPKHPPSVYRSEEMVLCQFFIQDEVAFSCIEALGHKDAVMFRDLNLDTTPREKPYYGEIEILNNAQGILRHIESLIKKRKMKIAPEDDDISTPIPGDLLDIKETLEKFSTEVKDIDQYIESLKNRHNETIEITTVMNLAKKYLKTAFEEVKDDEDPDSDPEDLEAGTRHAHEMKTMKINFIGGVVRQERFAAFEQTLWRASRGKVFVKFEHITYNFYDPGNVKPVRKTGFLVFFQGEILNGVSTKIAEGFRAKLYPIPEEIADFDEALEGSRAQRQDLEKIIDITEKRYDDLLEICAQNLENWYTQVLKMKAVYTTLNKFTTNPHIGEGWISINELPEVRKCITKVAKESGGLSDPVITVTECDEEPPTYFWNDKFTSGFQALIDAYGIATYKEVNPMPYTVITFPFLFSMMFGDLGHGMLMFAFGLTLILREKKMLAEKSRNEIRNIMFGGRYIIALMGLFSVYSGLIYNDCFGAAFNLFGSSWSVADDFSAIRAREFTSLDPATDYSGTPYPFGIDPVWDTAQNKIIFLNSFKMKISIIFGVIHMMFGLVLSFWNDWYFGLYSNILCLFVPQMLWMCALFGWLCFLVFFKWLMYGANMPFERGTTCAPSVLIHFISMILQRKLEAPPDCTPEMFEFQDIIQKSLFLLAIICVPWLLFTKPMVVFHQQAKEEAEAKKENDQKQLKIKDGIQSEQDVDEGDTDDDEAEQETEEDEKKTKQAGVRNQGDLRESEENETHGKEKGGKEQKANGEEVAEKETQERKERERFNESKKDDNKSVIIIPKVEEIIDKKGHENKMEFFIHQGILTIEYVLGTISHTASYLRLWALSLAHAQLSNVLWTMLLSPAIHYSIKLPPYAGFLIIFVIWAAWAVLTVSILVLMEGLSAFLHTLRLHWVEFNSKFYTGLGYDFAPFSFRRILSVERS